MDLTVAAVGAAVTGAAELRQNRRTLHCLSLMNLSCLNLTALNLTAVGRAGGRQHRLTLHSLR